MFSATGMDKKKPIDPRDKELAELIEWLKKKNLRVRIPRKGPPIFEQDR